MFNESFQVLYPKKKKKKLLKQLYIYIYICIYFKNTTQSYKKQHKKGNWTLPINFSDFPKTNSPPSIENPIISLPIIIPKSSLVFRFVSASYLLSKFLCQRPNRARGICFLLPIQPFFFKNSYLFRPSQCLIRIQFSSVLVVFGFGFPNWVFAEPKKEWNLGNPSIGKVHWIYYKAS